ncbi:hypothetical protein ACFBZI_07525 [Moraxella sp. ZJ142]|uniref:hypothetical protein n=1 Tax=Moraxella marmotae TaxID=3344520 RepID=UPI0035D44EEA
MNIKQYIHHMSKLKPYNAMSRHCLNGAVHSLKRYEEHGGELALVFALGNLRVIRRQIRIGSVRMTPTEVNLICRAIQHCENEYYDRFSK